MSKHSISPHDDSRSEPVRPDATPHRRRRLAPLPFGVRLLVLIVGGLLIAIGIAGLLLPGIQGILTIILGAAILSLASDWVYKLQRRVLGRWPSVSDRMERLRHRIHDWLSPRKHADSSQQSPTGAGDQESAEGRRSGPE